MSAWSALPAWMRRVPLIGWVAALLVVVFVMYLRSRRLRAAEEARTQAIAQAARARQKMAATEHAATAAHLIERQTIRQEVQESEARAAAAREQVERLRGQALADEINAVFGGK